MSTAEIESRYATAYTGSEHHGTARLSSDNRRLYLGRSDHRIQCLDLATGKELWQSVRQKDSGLTTLAISPDGRLLASGSGFEDPIIRIWDAASGRLIERLEGHTSWVCKLTFARDGRHLISAAADQSIRFWDTSNWSEAKILRGHSDEVLAVAHSEAAQLVASVSKDGDLTLWKANATGTADGYRRLPEDLGQNQVLSLDHSRVLLLLPGKPPELLDLTRDSPPVPLPEFGSSANILGCFGTNILCHWKGTNQILFREWRDAQFIQREAFTLDSGTRPAGFAYNAARQLLAWAEEASPASIYLASLARPDHESELMSDVPGLVPAHFSEDGNYLVAWTKEPLPKRYTLRAWNLETGQIVASVDEPFHAAVFAGGGGVLVVAIEQVNDHEIRFYDLINPNRAPRRVAGRHISGSLAVSPDGRLVASANHGGEVRLFDPAKGEWVGILHGHLNAAHGLAFSPDGQRLISTSGGRETVKVWDVGTRQELLTLVGNVSTVSGWSADGDVIFAGAPWQVWRAPSWEEIAAAEAQGKAEIK